MEEYFDGYRRISPPGCIFLLVLKRDLGESFKLLFFFDEYLSELAIDTKRKKFNVKKKMCGLWTSF